MSAAAEVERFFAVGVADRIAARPDVARAAGGRLRFDVTGTPDGERSWLVDLGADPPGVAEVAGEADCHLRLSAEDLAEMVREPAAGQLRAWQGRMQVGGDQAQLRRMSAVLFPPPEHADPAFDGYYTALSRLVSDERLTFLNHGWVGEDGEPPGVARAEDEPWRWAIGLVGRVLRGIDLEGARVLDVGCGRGGAAAWLARETGAAQVTGLDASADAIAFDRRRHAEAGLAFVHGYAEALPFADASFDVVLNVESSHCYPDRAGFFAEVARVLRPGGAFAYTDLMRGDAPARIERELATVPALALLEQADITPGVRRAIAASADGLAALLRGAMDPAAGNQGILGDLIQSLTVRMATDPTWTYHAWRLQRA